MAYQFSPETEKQFQWLLTRYPSKNATLIPLLHHVQKEVGWLSPEAIDYVGTRLELSPARVKEVASFYSLFRLEKTGKYVLQVCHNLTCYLRGADDLIGKLEGMLGIKAGETTPDGLFSLERVECLASCSTAPVMQVNDWEFHENLSPEKAETVIGDLKAGRCCRSSWEERTKEGSVA